MDSMKRRVVAMPFVARHVRLTNSGKVPDLFLAAKVQQPTELADAKLGKLFFVLQINCPWNHVAPIGTSIMNTVGREYFRQEGHVPLENFERAVAKANRLIEQLTREGETSCFENLHAVIALAVGDEVHITYAGDAEAYFLRDGKLNAIADPDRQPAVHDQTFTSLITGEVSAKDTILMGTPGLYGAVTTDDLETILQQPIVEATKTIARQVKTAKARGANAIILQIDTKSNLENETLEAEAETVYLDQAIDSTWQVIRYNLAKVGTPLFAGLAWLAHKGKKGGQKLGKRTQQQYEKVIAPKLAATGSQVTKFAEDRLHKASKQKLPTLAKLKSKLPFKKLASLPLLAKLPALAVETDDNVQVNHYGSRRRAALRVPRALLTPLDLLQDLGKQFRKAIKRSPRTWYAIIALVILASLGASVQMRKNQAQVNPLVPTASLEEMKTLLDDAKQAKAFGNADKVRELLTQAIAKGEVAKQNPKIATEASNLLGQAQRDLDVLASASRLTNEKPLITLPEEAGRAVVTEGVIYYTTNSGKLMSMRLTGGDPTELAELPDAQATNQLLHDAAGKMLYLQSYTGAVYSYSLATEKLMTITPSEGAFSLATGMGMFGETLYLLDPAENQIWKHTKAANEFAEATTYLKSKKTDLKDGIQLAIDGSIFVLHKTGVVHKFVRGTLNDFVLSGVPVPFNEITDPLMFSAVEDGNSYYLGDRGSATIPPRIVEFDKTGKFVHQYFLPQKWQKDIKLIIGNPKSHKAWALVNKDLYEFTLVQ